MALFLLLLELILFLFLFLILILILIFIPVIGGRLNNDTLLFMEKFEHYRQNAATGEAVACLTEVVESDNDKKKSTKVGYQSAGDTETAIKALEQEEMDEQDALDAMYSERANKLRDDGKAVVDVIAAVKERGPQIGLTVAQYGFG